MRTSTGDIWWKIFGKIKRESEKAYLWKLSRTGQEIWIPKSQTRDLDTFPDTDGDISILVKEWILNDKSVSENDRYSPNESRESKPIQNYTSAKEFFDDYDDDIQF